MTPKTVSFGHGIFHITSEDFWNGYQAGQQACRNAQGICPSDRHVTSLLMEQLEDVDHSELSNFGHVVGWLATLASNEVPDES